MKGLSDDFKASVAVSRQWDGKRVGQELVDEIKQDNVDPDFILLFSTIHYEGEFQKFLDIVKDEFPDAPLVGGTVAGFMSQEGCYTRGVSAMAVEYENMDVAVGVGHNTKRNPEGAAEECANEIKENMNNSDYENKMVYGFISDGMVPNLPLIGRKRVTRHKYFSKLIRKFSLFVTTILNKTTKFGVGREAEVLQELAKSMSNYNILTLSSYDNNKSLSNYQFSNKKVTTNSVVALGIKTDLNFQTDTSLGLQRTNTKIKIDKKGLFDCAFSEVNDEAASKELKKVLGWPEDFFDENIYRRTYYYPLCCEKGDLIEPKVIGLIIEDTVVCTSKIDCKELVLYQASGSSLIESVEKTFSDLDKNNDFLAAFLVSCTARLETLGANLYDVREKLLDFFEERPFLVTYGAGEGFHKPAVRTNYMNESFNISVLQE